MLFFIPLPRSAYLFICSEVKDLKTETEQVNTRYSCDKRGFTRFVRYSIHVLLRGSKRDCKHDKAMLLHCYMLPLKTIFCFCFRICATVTTLSDSLSLFDNVFYTDTDR